MRKKTKLTQWALCLSLVISFCSKNGYAQTESPCDYRATYLYWVGGVNSDFFDERNWREANRKNDLPETGTICRPGLVPKFFICGREYDPAADKVPKAGTLDPGKPIANNLLVEGANIAINSPLVFSCIDKGLTINGSQVMVNSEVLGTIHLNNNSTLRIAGASFPSSLRLSLQDHGSWVYFNQMNPVDIGALPLSRWMVDLQVPESPAALLISQYYQKGSVVRRDPTPFTPLTIYNASGLNGISENAGIHTIYKGSNIPGGLDNSIRSFKLKRGFMVTLAVNNNGTGKSKVYIASEEDLEVPELPAALSGNISFIRVMPWNWSTKKGTGGLFTNNPLDAGWFYTWSATETSKPNHEYVPMTWGAGATAPAAMQDIINKKSVTHLLGFNESDNCSGESGQFNNLCRPDVAVAYYERLMGSGLRLGTPAPRENGPTTWLREFARIAKERDVRFDFVAVHWYDWGSNPATSPGATAEAIFNRFKNYLAQVYNEYQLPIWVTEFNANPNRPNSTHAAFLELALPYLESLPYIERYAYFQPSAANSSNGDPNANYFVTGNTGALTNIGQLYLGHPSTPSVPPATYACPNNLEGMNQALVVKQEQQFVFEAECGKNPGSKWTIVDNELASNGKFIRGNNTLAGATDLAKQIHYDIEVVEENNFRFWVRTRFLPATGSGTVIIHIDHDRKDTITGITGSEFTWHPIPRLYTLKPGKHRITLSYIIAANNSNILQIDQIAMKAGSDDVTAPALPAESCSPEDLIWGLEEPAPVFAEAETASQGATWTTGNNEEAIGGQFVTSGAATSPAAAPAEPGWLTFTVDVTTAGAYQFWAKVQALEASSNKLWLKMNDGAFNAWAGLQQPGYLWKWVRYDAPTNDGTQQAYLFLQPGTYTFTIAYASGGVKIDRVGLIPAGISAAAIDADVIIATGPQSFEAEHAVFIGTPTLAAACPTASNGLVVNMGTLAGNGLQFGNILVATAGPYQLAISYFVGGTANRSMRVFVNGTLQPVQSLAPSGPWCFEGGSPGTWFMSVNLVAGNNIIELRPVSGTNAPLIDKIEIRPILASFEAEQATLSGTMVTPVCASASNGLLLNMGSTLSNAATFSNISVPTAGTYQLNITYFSKVARTMRMFVNGGAATNLSFAITGNWCFESPAGVAVVKAVPVTLAAGVNSIRFQPQSGDAPVLDKIDIVDPSNPAPGAADRQPDALAAMRQSSAVGTGMVYPNPASPGSVIYIPQTGEPTGKPVNITLFDARGAALKSSVQDTRTGFRLPNTATGMYLLRVQDGSKVQTYRIMIR